MLKPGRNRRLAKRRTVKTSSNWTDLILFMLAVFLLGSMVGSMVGRNSANRLATGAVVGAREANQRTEHVLRLAEELVAQQRDALRAQLDAYGTESNGWHPNPREAPGVVGESDIVPLAIKDGRHFIPCDRKTAEVIIRERMKQGK